jgi:hypothetical protein
MTCKLGNSLYLNKLLPEQAEQAAGNCSNAAGKGY